MRYYRRVVLLWRHIGHCKLFVTQLAPLFPPLPAAASARPLPAPLGGAGAGRGRLNGTLPHWGCLGHCGKNLRSQKGSDASCQRAPGPSACSALPAAASARLPAPLGVTGAGRGWVNGSVPHRGRRHIAIK